MVFLTDLIKITDTKYISGFINCTPFDEKDGVKHEDGTLYTQEELEQEGILVESIPEPQQVEGKDAVLYVNPVTKELFYEYIDIPKTEDEKQEVLTQVIAQLSIDNARKDTQIESLVQAVAGLNMEIAQLKGGSN